MSQSPDADPLDARFGNSADSRQIDAAGGFEFDHCGSRASRRSDRLAEHRGSHVVQKYDVRPRGEHFVKLFEGIDFNFDDHLPPGLAKALFAVLPRLAHSLAPACSRRGPEAEAPRQAPNGCL